jgi:hypothetical protein
LVRDFRGGGITVSSQRYSLEAMLDLVKAGDVFIISFMPKVLAVLSKIQSEGNKMNS